MKVLTAMVVVALALTQETCVQIGNGPDRGGGGSG